MPDSYGICLTRVSFLGPITALKVNMETAVPIGDENEQEDRRKFRTHDQPRPIPEVPARVREDFHKALNRKEPGLQAGLRVCRNVARGYGTTWIVVTVSGRERQRAIADPRPDWYSPKDLATMNARLADYQRQRLGGGLPRNTLRRDPRRRRSGCRTSAGLAGGDTADGVKVEWPRIRRCGIASLARQRAVRNPLVSLGRVAGAGGWRSRGRRGRQPVWPAGSAIGVPVRHAVGSVFVLPRDRPVCGLAIDCCERSD